jgi:hypothetical protein
MWSFFESIPSMFFEVKQNIMVSSNRPEYYYKYRNQIYMSLGARCLRIGYMLNILTFEGRLIKFHPYPRHVSFQDVL